MVLDSSYVRITSLARELEIKAKVLIEYLPQIGVTEGKTHSSSIDAEHAELVRAHFRTRAEGRAVSLRATPSSVPQPAAAELVVASLPKEGAEPTREQLLARIAELEAQLGISPPGTHPARIQTAGVLTPRTHRMLSCPHCGAQLRADRLSRHQLARCPKLYPSKRKRTRKGRNKRHRAVLCQGGLPSLGKRR